MLTLFLGSGFEATFQLGLLFGGGLGGLSGPVLRKSESSNPEVGVAVEENPIDETKDATSD